MNKYVFVIILILLLYPILNYNNYEGMSGDTDTTPSKSEKINLPLKDSGESLFNRITKAYDDSSSNGVFLSIILQLPGNGNILLDGSGSIVRKDIYKTTYGSPCDIGLIWDTDWLEPSDNKKTPVECLFPVDSATQDFGKDCTYELKGLPSGKNFCTFANTSNDTPKEPDRCSRGLEMAWSWHHNPHGNQYNLPNPTNCSQNKIYNLDTMDEDDLNDNENCFQYITNGVKKIKNFFGPYGTYNEGVFLKDIKSRGGQPIPFGKPAREAFSEMNDSKKMLPSALLLLNSPKDCFKLEKQKILLNALRNNFEPNTVVILANYNNNSGISFENYTTLEKMV